MLYFAIISYMFNSGERNCMTLANFVLFVKFHIPGCTEEVHLPKAKAVSLNFIAVLTYLSDVNMLYETYR